MLGRLREGTRGTLTGALATVVALGTPLLFGAYCYRQLLSRLDSQLDDVRPLVVTEATAALQRPVKIGKLSTGLSLATIRALLTHPERYTSYPIVAEEIEIGCRPEELKDAGQSWVVRIQRATALLSAPAALGGKFVTGGLRQVTLEHPELLVVRDAKGKLNLEHLAPETKEPPDPKKPLFQTEVLVRGGRVRVRDFASALSRGRVEENTFHQLSARALLVGPHSLRFHARLLSDGATRTHLSGPIDLTGTVARDIIADPARPFLTLDASLSGLDLPYAARYAALLPAGVALTRGRTDAHVQLLLPTKKDPKPQVWADARFQEIDAQATRPVKADVHGLSGQAHLEDKLLSVVVAGKALDAPFQAAAKVALESPTPRLEATLSMPQVPVRRILGLLPDLKLPPDVTVGPTLALEYATVQGTMTNPTVVAYIAGGSVGMKGLPTVERLRTKVTLAQGEVRTEQIEGHLRGGGTLTAQGHYRFAQPNGKLLAKASWSGVVDAKVRDIELGPLDALKKLSFRPKGKLSSDVHATIQGEHFSGTALVRGEGFQVAGLSFPTLSLQAALDGKQFNVSEGALSGPVGAVRLTGSGTIGGNLAFEGHLVGADLGRAASAFGIPGVEGVLSASASVSGSTSAPTILLRDVTVLQPRYRVNRQYFVADAAYVERATLQVAASGEVQATLDPQQPLRIYHTPATAQISGSVSTKNDTTQLNLTANAANIELDELFKQAADEPARFASDWLKQTESYRQFLEELDWSGSSPSPGSGRIISASATLTGDSENPEIRGSVTVGRCLIRSFPIDDAQVSFALENRNFSVHDLTLNTPTGQITGEGHLFADGTLSGKLTADELNLEALSSLAGLSDSLVGITGMLEANVTVSGTKEHPKIVAQLQEVRPLEVAGLPLRGLDMGEIQIEPELVEGQPVRGKVLLPQFAIRLGDGEVEDAAALLSAKALQFDLGTQEVTGEFALTGARFQRILEVLSHGHFDSTPEGQDFLKSLYNVSKAMDATAALTGTLAARITPDGPRDRRANLSLTSDNINLESDTDSTARFKGKLVARATLLEETLTLDSLTLTQLDAPDDEPTVLRALPHPTRDPATGETRNAKSWIRLPYDSKQPLEYHVTLDANAVPLDLGRLAQADFPVRGRATVTIGADGTPELPTVTASFFANSLLVGNTVGTAGQFNPPPLTVDLMRFQVELKGANKKDWNVTISDGLLTHNKENINFEGLIPLNQEESRVAASRPINLSVSSAEGITVKTLAQYANLRGIQLDGVIKGRVGLTGTLNDPLLGGKVEVLQASARFPAPTTKVTRDTINPIRSLALTIELAGREIRFPQAELTMAALPPRETKKNVSPVVLANLPTLGTFSLEPGSVIRIENLEDFTRLFVRETEIKTQPKLRGEFDITGRFRNFRLDADNASSIFITAEKLRGIGLEEALSGQLNGTLRIRGPLLTPLIATLPNEKLSISDLQFRIPRNSLPGTVENSIPVFNPRFEIEVATQTDAKLSGYAGGAYEFRGEGNVSIGGDIGSPKIEGVLIPTGGFYKYPLSSPFNVQRGGEIRLTYAKRFEAGQDKTQFDVRMTDVIAEGKVAVSASAVSAARSTPRATDFNRQVGLTDESLIGKRVRVTARFDGLLQLGETAQQTQGHLFGLPVQLSSDANLSELEILSLLVPYQMLSQFAGNGSQQAMKDSISLLSNSLSSRFLLDPVTRQIQSLFGLDNFTVDYDLTGLATVFFSRRLNEPLDRMTIEVRRSFQTKSSTGTLLPQLYSVNYELLQLRRGTRVQLGASTNEQRDNQFFLRGTLRY